MTRHTSGCSKWQREQVQKFARSANSLVISVVITLARNVTYAFIRGIQREYSSKPVKHEC